MADKETKKPDVSAFEGEGDDFEEFAGEGEQLLRKSSYDVLLGSLRERGCPQRRRAAKWPDCCQALSLSCCHSMILSPVVVTIASTLARWH